MTKTIFDSRDYEESGCFDEEAAEMLYDAGITPEQANTPIDENVGLGHYSASIGYKFANNDISLRDVREMLEVN